MSRISIVKGRFDEALEFLSKVEPLDIIFKLYINATLLIIYYSKNESESFHSLIDSFRHFLKRNKDLRNADRVSYNYFISFMRKLYALQSNPGKKDLSEFQILKVEIEKNNETVYKNWLLKKLIEILNDKTK